MDRSIKVFVILSNDIYHCNLWRWGLTSKLFVYQSSWDCNLWAIFAPVMHQIPFLFPSFCIVANFKWHWLNNIMCYMTVTKSIWRLSISAPFWFRILLFDELNGPRTGFCVSRFRLLRDTCRFRMFGYCTWDVEGTFQRRLTHKYQPSTVKRSHEKYIIQWGRSAGSRIRTTQDSYLQLNTRYSASTK